NQYDPGAWQRTRQLIQSEDLHPVDEADDVILWLRGARDTVELLTLGEFDPAAEAQVVFDGQLRFRGCDLLGRVRRPGEVLTLRTYWRRVAPGDRVFLTRLWIIDRQNREVFYRTRYLGYGVATPDQWPEGRTARETYRIVLPGDLARGTYDLVMQVAHKTEAGGEPALPDDPRLSASGRIRGRG